jgi:hypothetical protein
MRSGSTLLLALCSLALPAAAVEIGSLVFYDFTHDATVDGPGDGAFELSRAYITLTDKPADHLSYKLQFDVGRAGSDTGDAGLEAYVKSACVDWKTGTGTWTFGMQGMNLFNVQENTFGNRFLAKPLMDEVGYSSSADLGVGYANSLGGRLKASVLYTNGSGYKKPENDKYKKLSLQLVAGETALNRKDGWNAGLVYSLEPTSPDFARTVLGVFGGWAGKGLRLGAEFDTRTIGGDTEIGQSVLGFYGNYRLPLDAPVEALAQLALVDPNTDADDDGETDLILGLKFTPAKGLVIAPNIRTVTFENEDAESELYYRLNFEFRI